MNAKQEGPYAGPAIVEIKGYQTAVGFVKFHMDLKLLEVTTLPGSAVRCDSAPTTEHPCTRCHTDEGTDCDEDQLKKPIALQFVAVDSLYRLTPCTAAELDILVRKRHYTPPAGALAHCRRLLEGVTVDDHCEGCGEFEGECSCDNSPPEPAVERVATRRTIVYVHGSDEAMYATGEEIGLAGEALDRFRVGEVGLTLDVDMQTGEARIVACEGHELVDAPLDEVPLREHQLCAEIVYGIIGHPGRWAGVAAPEYGHDDLAARIRRHRPDPFKSSSDSVEQIFEHLEELAELLNPADATGNRSEAIDLAAPGEG